VRSIEISGNVRVQDAEILAALESLGAGRGSRFRDLPYTYLEQQMRLRISDIEWITLRHTGGRLIVDLTEETPPPPMQNERIPCNVVAAVPAQITEMSVEVGEALCRVGDAVQAGEILISGTRTDKYGTARYYHAAGVVRGIYEADFELEQPFVAELPVHGSTVTETLLELFGQRFSVTPGFTPPAPASETVYEEDTEPLTVLGHPLPLALVRGHYTQQTYAVTAFSEAEAQAILTEAAARWERNFHADDRIISRTAEFRQTDLGIMLKEHYVFEGVIGERNEFFVKLS
jgi:similar to stage IV sporulation protein